MSESLNPKLRIAMSTFGVVLTTAGVWFGFFVSKTETIASLKTTHPWAFHGITGVVAAGLFVLMWHVASEELTRRQKTALFAIYALLVYGALAYSLFTSL